MIGQAVVHTQRDRGRVHHLKSSLEHLDVLEVVEHRRLRGAGAGRRRSTPSTPVPLRIASAWISSAICAAVVSVEKNGRPESRREDHDAPLLEMAHRLARDVRLGDLRHRDGGLHPGHDPGVARARPAARARSSRCRASPRSRRAPGPSRAHHGRGRCCRRPRRRPAARRAR